MVDINQFTFVRNYAIVYCVYILYHVARTYYALRTYWSDIAIVDNKGPYDAIRQSLHNTLSIEVLYDVHNRVYIIIIRIYVSR